MPLDDDERFHEQALAVDVDFENDFFEGFLRGHQVVVLCLQGASTRLQLVEFLERLHVDAAETSQLSPQVLDFLLGSLGIEGWRLGRSRLLRHQVGQFDLVVVAKALDERIALMAQIRRFEFTLMRALLMHAPFAARALRLL